MKNIIKNTLISIAITTALTACGGGGGGGSAGGGGGAIVLGGGVGKGIIKQGIITAIELKTDGTELREVGSATTDNDGAYTLTLASSYSGGAILLKLTADASTKMVCDALDGCVGIAYGNDIDPPANFEMQAIAPPSTNGNSVSVQVTPFSHMAAANAKNSMSNGATAAKAVADAVTQINQITGVDILTTEPVDITRPDIASKPKDARKYALLNAAFADVAYDGGVDRLQTALNEYATEFENGRFDANDAGNEEDLSLLFTKLDTQLNDSKNDNIGQDAKEDIIAQKAIIKADTSEDGSYDPTPTDNTNKTDVEKAKELVTETRTWLTSFSELESPAGAFGSDIETIATTLDSNTAAVLEVTLKAVEAGSNAIINAIQAETTPPAFVTVFSTDDVAITELVTTGDNPSFKLSATDLAGVTMSFSLEIDQPLSSTAQDISGKTLNIKLSGNTSNNYISATLKESTVTLKALPALTTAASTTAQQDTPLESASLTGGIKLAKLSAGSPTGEEVEASILFNFVSLNSGAVEAWRLLNSDDPLNNLSLKQMKLSKATVKNTEGSTAGLSIDLTIDNAASLDTLARLQDGNTVNFYKSYQSDPIGFSSYAHGLTGTLSYAGFDNGLNGEKTYFDNGENFVNESSDTLDVTTFVSNQIANQNINNIRNISAYYSNTTTHGETTGINATFDVVSKETAESFIKGSLTVTGNMSLKDLQPATAAITVNRTGYKAGNVSIKLAYDGRILDIDVSNTTGETGALSAGTANGTKLVVSSSGGTVTVGGKEIGTISDSNGVMIIRYNDGTFKSLFNKSALTQLLSKGQ